MGVPSSSYELVDGWCPARMDISGDWGRLGCKWGWVWGPPASLTAGGNLPDWQGCREVWRADVGVKGRGGLLGSLLAYKWTLDLSPALRES